MTSFIDYSPTNTARNILLVGNKLDLASEKRQVSFSDAEGLARRMGLAGAVETSAKEGSETLNDSFYITAVNAMDFKEGEKLEAAKTRKGAARGRMNSDQPSGRLSSATKTTREQRGLHKDAVSYNRVTLKSTDPTRLQK